MNTTHAIILGGILKDLSGRPLGPYRLRSACAAQGFNAHVIDYAWALSSNELLTIIESLVSDKTLVLGISNVWFSKSNQTFNDTTNAWFSDEFFDEVARRWPHIEIVIGGSKPTLVQGAHVLKKKAKWWLTGFADIGFVKLLEKLSGRNNEFFYTIDGDGTKVCDCNQHYRVQNMDELETVYHVEDKFHAHQPLSLEVSRGCIFKCAFCSHPFLGKKSYDYIRSAESIASELKRNYDLFGTTRYQITDDTFNDSLEKLERVERAIDLSGIPNFEFVGYIRSELLVTTPAMIPALARLNCRGGFIGVESMGKKARLAIGKGMDFNRVADALANFKANSRVRLHAGMIVGLPHDTLEDCESYAARLKTDGIFSNWRFQALGLVHDQDRNGLSLFEQQPEKYGYTITKWLADSGKDWTCSWENTMGINSRTAELAANKINEIDEKTKTAGGFSVGEMWFHGYSDLEIDNLPTSTSKIGRRSLETGLARKEVELDIARSKLKIR
jgi:hypothetical protein